MSRRSKNRLDTVEQVFSMRESSVAREVAARQRSLQHARDQLDLLRSSRAEYVSLAPGGRVSAGEWANRAAFLARLAKAIEAQEHSVQRAERDVAEAEGRLAATRQRSKAVEKVSEKRRAVAQREADRREQNEIDALPRPSGRGEA